MERSKHARSSCFSAASTYKMLVLVAMVTVSQIVKATQVGSSSTSDGRIVCGPHEHELNGQLCCSECAPGQGVTNACSPDNETRCEQCTFGESYSPVYSHIETCRPCSICPPYSHVQHTCNVTHDTTCECDRNYHYDRVSKGCRICSLCPMGQGARRKCNSTHNTLCWGCPQGTYSDRPSLQPCQKCSPCQAGQAKLQPCSSVQDTVCIDIPPMRSTAFVEIVTEPGSKSNTEAEESDEMNVIPIYCGILGSLILALIVYVIVAQRRRIKQKKLQKLQQNGGLESPPLLNQSGALPPSPMPNQGSDSGVYVDQDLYNRPVTGATHLRDLPPLKRKALENSLHGYQGNDQSGWKHLAMELGFSPADVSSIESQATLDGFSPIPLMLHEWGQTEGATVMTLAMALRNIHRDDCVRILYGDPKEYIYTPKYMDQRTSPQIVV